MNGNSKFSLLLLETYYNNIFSVKYKLIDRYPFYADKSVSDYSVVEKQRDNCFIIRDHRDSERIQPYFDKFDVFSDTFTLSCNDNYEKSDVLLADFKYIIKEYKAEYQQILSEFLDGLGDEDYKAIVRSIAIKYINFFKTYHPKVVINCNYPSIDESVLRYLSNHFGFYMVTLSHGMATNHPFHRTLAGHCNILFSRLSEKVVRENDIIYDGELLTVAHPALVSSDDTSAQTKNVVVFTNMVKGHPLYEKVKDAFSEAFASLAKLFSSENIYIKPHEEDDRDAVEFFAEKYGCGIIDSRAPLADIIKSVSPCLAVTSCSTSVFDMIARGIPSVAYDPHGILESYFPDISSDISIFSDIEVFEEEIKDGISKSSFAHLQNMKYVSEINDGLPDLYEMLRKIIVNIHS